MRPIKAKDLVPQVATEVDISPDVAMVIINHYWREVRKALSGLKHSRVHVTNLGDFVVKHWKLDEKIMRLEQFEESNRLKGLQQITARFKTAETLYDLKSLKKIIEEENQRAEFIKLHKKTSYVTKGEPDQDLEEQGSDT